jgi:hypothetical protein
MTTKRHHDRRNAWVRRPARETGTTAEEGRVLRTMRMTRWTPLRL